jgi:hypothetical protein
MGMPFPKHGELSKMCSLSRMPNERVYITAIGCEIEFGGARELQAAGAGGL